MDDASRHRYHMALLAEARRAEKMPAGIARELAVARARLAILDVEYEAMTGVRDGYEALLRSWGQRGRRAKEKG